MLQSNASIKVYSSKAGSGFHLWEFLGVIRNIYEGHCTSYESMSATFSPLWEAPGREALKQKKGYEQMFEGASFFCKLAACNVQLKVKPQIKIKT